MKKFFKTLAKILAVLVFEVVYILGLGIYLIYYTDMFTTTRDSNNFYDNNDTSIFCYLVFI